MVALVGLLLAQDFAALFNTGLEHYSARRFEDAVAPLMQAAQLRPKDFNAHYLLGGSLAQLGRTRDALREWRAAQAIQPGHLKLLQLMTVEYSKGRYFQEAAGVARQALKVAPADAGLYFLAIKALQDAGDFAAALGVAKQAAE